MAAASTEFGSWHTAADGTAHYILGGKCLCGAKVKASGAPPQRKPLSGPGGSGAFITPLCEECKTLNDARWRGKSGAKAAEALQPRRWHWWRHRKRTKK